MILTNLFKLKESSLDVEMSFLKSRMLISDVSTAIIENSPLFIDRRLNNQMNARIAKQKEVSQLFITCQPSGTNNTLRCRKTKRTFLMEKLLITFNLLLSKSMLIMSDQEIESKLLVSSELKDKELFLEEEL